MPEIISYIIPKPGRHPFTTCNTNGQVNFMFTFDLIMMMKKRNKFDYFFWTFWLWNLKDSMIYLCIMEWSFLKKEVDDRAKKNVFQPAKIWCLTSETNYDEDCTIIEKVIEWKRLRKKCIKYAQAERERTDACTIAFAIRLSCSLRGPNSELIVAESPLTATCDLRKKFGASLGVRAELRVAALDKYWTFAM